MFTLSPYLPSLLPCPIADLNSPLVIEDETIMAALGRRAEPPIDYHMVSSLFFPRGSVRKAEHTVRSSTEIECQLNQVADISHLLDEGPIFFI